MTSKNIKLNRFFPVSKDAAIEYGGAQTFFVAEVNAVMLARSDIIDLIGPTGAELMLDNHKNHAAFMSLVLLYNRFDILHETLPWVYRAYHNQGFSYDYFPIVLTAWINILERRLKPPSVGEIVAVYREMIHLHNQTIIRSRDTKPFERFYTIPEQWREAQDSFRKGMLAGDCYACLDIAAHLCLGAEDILNFCRWVIQPSLYWIGDLWENGQVTVAQEHLSTAIASRVMSSLPVRFRVTSKTKGRVLVLAVSNEHHEIGAWMVADSLEADGWDVAFLGCDVPSRDVYTHLASFKPHLLALSVTMQYNIRNAADIITRIKNDSGHPGIKIMVGGLAFSAFSDLAENIGADSYGTDCHDAISSANKIWEEIQKEL